MPKLTAQSKKLRNIRFLNALQETDGNPTEAAKLVGRIGSQGAKDPEASAHTMGTKRLKQVELTILDSLTEKGVNSDKIADKINELLEHADHKAIDKGIAHALKIGVGGGYAPEKRETVSVNINATPEEMNKYNALRDKYEAELKEQLLQTKTNDQI